MFVRVFVRDFSCSCVRACEFVYGVVFVHVCVAAYVNGLDCGCACACVRECVRG